MKTDSKICIKSFIAGVLLMCLCICILCGDLHEQTIFHTVTEEPLRGWYSTTVWVCVSLRVIKTAC